MRKQLISETIWLRLIGLALSFLTIACGQANNDQAQLNPGNTDCIPEIGQGSKSKGLVFTAVSGGYESSNVYFLDFESGCLRTLLTGQSSDPMVKTIDGEVYLFNRQLTDSNFLNLKFENGFFLQGTQLANPIPGDGDPADVIAWQEDEMLMAARTDLSIARVDRATGALMQRVDTTAWDTAGNPFYPHALFSRADEVGKEVYILNSFHGSYDDQRIFILREDEQKNLVAVDLNPNEPLVQGFKPYFNNPSRVLYRDSDQPLIVSFCTSYAKEACRGGVDVFDLENEKFVSFNNSYGLYDFSSFARFGESHYDAIEAGGDREFFLRVSKKDETERKILHIKPIHNTFEIKHVFDPETRGETAMFYEKDADLFIVGEGLGGDRGRLVAYLTTGERLELELIGMPYNGTFIPATE